MVTFTEQELHEITELISEVHKLDFRNYAKSSFSRRIMRIMTINALQTRVELENYIRNINDTNQLIEEITVNTTEMFRDPTFWVALRNNILPILNTHDNIRIWHAGCSTGEEVLSMQILAKELGLRSKITAYATDIDQTVIAKAQSATYSKKNFILNESNYKAAGGTGSLNNYISNSNEISQTFDQNLLDNVTFKKFDLVKDTMYTKFDLILCRNVLIYFDFTLQEMVIQKYISNLFSRGFIAIGQKETILSPANLNDLILYDSAEKIYQYNK